ncbi:MAG: hypothetical protein VX466_06010 [Myxococcota bacterium]|nr:hypothetical protein [Myxococcota bacterium]
MHLNLHTKLLSTLVLCLVLFGSRAGAEDRVRILLLPIVVHSAESPYYVQHGLADMLTARLERIPDLEVLRIDDAAAATTNLEKALERARKLDAEFVLFGSFTRFGTGASLDVHCAVATYGGEGEPLREVFLHSGSLGDVIPDLDDLVGKVARFVVQGYSERAAGPEEFPALRSSGQALSDLERRVEALEQALRGLSGQIPESGSEDTVGGGPE